MRMLDAFARAAVTPIRKSAVPLSGVGNGSWVSLFLDRPPGAFQRDDQPTVDTILSNPIVYACVSLIAGDFGKLRQTLIAYDAAGLFDEIESAAFSPVLRKPNRYQTHIQFKEWWITSKLLYGNTYGLLERDQRGIVVHEYVLDPRRTLPLVAPDGSVFYQLGEDNLSGLRKGAPAVPASEIIHDRMNCLFHPLVGTSPMFASGLAAEQGLRIQRDSRTFFGNNSSPGGILTAPGPITDAQAARMKAHWDANYTGANAGKVAVLGDGLKFEAMRMSALNSQTVEQSKGSDEKICSTFHVPGYKVGVGPAPLNSNAELMDQQYYSQCLQTLFENYEECQIYGLGLDTPKDGVRMGVRLDLSGLMRMDQKTQMEVLAQGVEKTLLTPNEGRRPLNKKPVKGGDTLYVQQQDYSIEAIAERDANEPFAKPAPAVPAVPAAPTEPADDPPADDEAKGVVLEWLVQKELRERLAA